MVLRNRDLEALEQSHEPLRHITEKKPIDMTLTGALTHDQQDVKSGIMTSPSLRYTLLGAWVAPLHLLIACRLTLSCSCQGQDKIQFKTSKVLHTRAPQPTACVLSMASHYRSTAMSTTKPNLGGLNGLTTRTGWRML